MASPAAIAAARALLQVDRAPSDERILSIAGSAVGCTVYRTGAAGRADAEGARAAISSALTLGVVRYLCEACPDSDVPTSMAAALVDEVVAVEERQAGPVVLICGYELPGPEPLGAHILRRTKLTLVLAEELDRAASALSAPADEPGAPTLRRGDARLLPLDGERAVGTVLAEELAAAHARIAELEAQLAAACARPAQEGR